MRYLVEKKINDNLELLKERNIPDKYPKEFFTNPKIALKRNEIIKLHGFPLLTSEWMAPLANWISKRKVLEIMSGCGALSKALIQSEIDIIPTDSMEWERKWNQMWCDVEKIDCIDAIEKYKDRDLVIMSWCPLNSDLDSKCLLKMREVNPNMLMLVIGEMNGCTGSTDFWNNMHIVNDNEFNKINELYQSWLFIHDRVFLVK